MRSIARALVVCLLFVGGVACSDSESGSGDGAAAPGESAATATSAPSSGDGSTTTTAAPTEVTREILAQTEPADAPGQTLYLYRVTIPVGASIALHHHPGTQIARIEQGTLTYTIESGTVGVGRDGSETVTETMEGPTVLELAPGDSVYENEQLIHEAQNNSDEPVVILLASLLRTDEEMSITEEG